MKKLTDEKLELAVGRMLQTGVLLAAVVVLTGGILFLIHAPAGARTNYSHFHAVAQHLRRPNEIWHGVMHGDAGSVIQLGLLLLIATPVMRVVLAGVGFLMERDKLYFWVSAIVLAVLLYSLWHIR
ncbi:MAG TPA: DUF1634 domain-containing protein [Acidobacteriaceae bacterium]|nr:DUF1634 domain-containing protein [Acidobacteriaceae bacterium]